MGLLYCAMPNTSTPTASFPITCMMGLKARLYMGLIRIKWHWLDQLAKRIINSILTVLSISTFWTLIRIHGT